MTDRFHFTIVPTETRDLAGLWGLAREAEGLGYGSLRLRPGGPLPPWLSLGTAAVATDDLRIGTLEIDVASQDPSALGSEVAALDRATGGRVLVGLADTVSSDWIDSFRRSIEDRVSPDSVRAPGTTSMPLMVTARAVGSWTDWADGIDLTPTDHDHRCLTAEAVLEDLQKLSASGIRLDRFERLVRIRAVAPDGDLAGLGGGFPTLDPEELESSPFFLAGPPDALADQVRAIRDRFGISAFAVPEPAMMVLAPVVEILSGSS